MELAWFLTGLSNWALACPEKQSRLRDLAFQTFDMLKKNRGEQGFFGHLARDASVQGMTRGRIGSFADQVYPIYAMTRFSQAYQRGKRVATGSAMRTRPVRGARLVGAVVVAL